jgi:hypothetical protein
MRSDHDALVSLLPVLRQVGHEVVHIRLTKNRRHSLDDFPDGIDPNGDDFIGTPLGDEVEGDGADHRSQLFWWDEGVTSLNEISQDHSHILLVGGEVSLQETATGLVSREKGGGEYL